VILPLLLSLPRACSQTAAHPRGRLVVRGGCSALGAVSVTTSALNDTVTGTFVSDEAVSDTHRHLWSTSAGRGGGRLPARSNHSRECDCC
jgi:hypothetical protein